MDIEIFLKWLDDNEKIGIKYFFLKTTHNGKLESIEDLADTLRTYSRYRYRMVREAKML